MKNNISEKLMFFLLISKKYLKPIIFKFVREIGDIMKIGIDIGGTNTRIGFNKDGKIYKSIVIKTHIENFVDGIKKIADCILQEAHQDEIEFIGMGCPGPFEGKTTKICNAPNLQDWNNNDPKQELNKHFPNTKIIMINDANLQCLNEFKKHHGNPFIFLTFSTGIGGAIIINNKILNGFSNASMEVCNAIPSYEYFKSFDNAGIEFFCSGNNIPKRAKEYGCDVQDAKQTFNLYKNNDANAIKYFDEYKNKMVQFLSTLIYIINPEKIVVNGPLVQHYKNFFDEIFNKTCNVTKNINYKTQFVYSDNDLNSLLLTASNLDKE